MRTPIRLPGRGRLAPRLMAATVAASLAASLVGAGLVVAAPAHIASASRTAADAARPAVHVTAPSAAQVAPIRATRAPAAEAGALTSSACSGSPGAYTCELWAQTGTLTLPDATTAPIYGYSSTSAGPAGLPGPTLIVTAGSTVTVNLHNVNVPNATSLSVSGLAGLIPDTTGVTSGGSKSYTLTASAPGTYLYEAGLTPDGPRQVAMGLYGALIVRPASCPTANCAYGTAASAFDDEALLVLSEVDPAFNAAPATFNLSYFAPRYWLINGKGYPATDPITSDVGHSVLLRFVNAGLDHHSMSLLGLRETVLATDGKPAANPETLVDDTIPSGSTVDAVASIPAAAPAGTQYALFEGAMHLDNNGIRTTPPAANPANTPIAFGGMLTFITVAGTTTQAPGPVTSGVTLSPNPTDGSVSVAVGATVAASGGANVAAAEYFIDSVGATGTGAALAGSFGSPTAAVNATISVATLATLASGSHTVYVRGQDSNGTWGAVASATLNLDTSGPAISSQVATPALSNGTVDVNLQATASDAASGGANVTAAEYFIDSQPASTVRGTAMATSTPAADVSATATIPAATVLGLADGNHTVAIRAQDALGNWGAFGTLTITVDKSAPATSAVSATPNPTNGQIGVQIGSTGQLYERIDASITDPVIGGVNSNIVAAEYFIDATGADGSGGPMLAGDGVFNSPAEGAVGAAEVFGIAALSPGNHTISVHGKDAAGNWGAFATTVLVIDKAGPTSSGVSLTPPASNNSAVTVAANASDVATGNANISGGEAFLDAVGVSGTGFAMSAAAAAPATSISGTIPGAAIAALTPGNHTVYVHARDVAGNWGPTATGTLLVDRTAPTIAGITLTPASVPAGTASVTLALTGTADPLVGGLASGVAGGEWWFGTTNPAAGGGQAFAGLSTSIATSCLAPGTYTVRARVRDVAGNWSTGTSGVRSATLTVSGPAGAGIFCDGFEAPNILPGTWSSRSTTSAARLSVTAAAALTGSWGLQAQGNNTNYVQYNFGSAANPAAAAYDARFYFRPNGNTSTGKDILSAASSNTFGTVRFRVRYRLNAGQTQVQIQVGTGNANTTWTTVSSTSSNVIEVVWQSGSTLTLTVNGVLSQTLAAPAGSIGAVRLGSVTTTGNATALSLRRLRLQADRVAALRALGTPARTFAPAAGRAPEPGQPPRTDRCMHAPPAPEGDTMLETATAAPGPGQAARSRTVLRDNLTALALAAALLLLSVVFVIVAPPAPSSAAGSIPTSPAIEAKWGIRIAHVAVTADGGLVDVRFVVLDPDKALDMMQDVNNLPVLLPEGTSAVVGSVAQMAARHDLNPGQTYFLLYRNPAGALRPGMRVTVRFGDLTLQHVAAE